MIFNRRRAEPLPEPDWDDPMYVPQPVERWIEPEEIIHRQRRRRGRWRALRHAVVLLLIILVVGGVGVVAGGAVLGRWDLPWSPPGGRAAPSAAPSVDPLDCERAVVVPAGVAGTNVEVLNSTSRSGLASMVGNALEGRGFTIADVGNYSGDAPEAAIVLFPSAAEPPALAVAAHVQGAVLRPDERVDVVTLVLGDEWTGLVDRDAAAEAAQVPQPSVVACAAGSGQPSTPTG